ELESILDPSRRQKTPGFGISECSPETASLLVQFQVLWTARKRRHPLSADCWRIQRYMASGSENCRSYSDPSRPLGTSEGTLCDASHITNGTKPNPAARCFRVCPLTRCPIS